MEQILQQFTMENILSISLVFIGLSLGWSGISLFAFYRKAQPGEHEEESLWKPYLRGDTWLLIFGGLGFFYVLFEPRNAEHIYWVAILMILFFAPFVRSFMGIFIGYWFNHPLSEE